MGNYLHLNVWDGGISQKWACYTGIRKSNKEYWIWIQPLRIWNNSYFERLQKQKQKCP